MSSPTSKPMTPLTYNVMILLTACFIVIAMAVGYWLGYGLGKGDANWPRESYAADCGDPMNESLADLTSIIKAIEAQEVTPRSFTYSYTCE